MALRWRLDGQLLCAAKCGIKKGDTYINDRLHYELSVIQQTIVADIDEETTGKWYWLHGWCTTSEHPRDVPESAMIRATAPYPKVNVDRLPTNNP